MKRHFVSVTLFRLERIIKSGYRHLGVVLHDTVCRVPFIFFVTSCNVRNVNLVDFYFLFIFFTCFLLYNHSICENILVMGYS